MGSAAMLEYEENSALHLGGKYSIIWKLHIFIVEGG